MTANESKADEGEADSGTVQALPRAAGEGRSTARLAAIVESADDAIIGKTLGGIITDWNQSAERIFGYTAQEAVGQHISMLIPKGRMEEETEIIRQIAAGERVLPHQTQRRTKDGRTVDVMLSVAPIRDKAGRIVGASKIVRDMTELYSVRDALAQQKEKLRKTNQELERYAYIASHDLQEPLRTVASFARLLDQRCGDKVGPEGKEYLRFMLEGVERMQQLMQDLLTYSRVEAREAPFEVVDCNTVMAKTLENLAGSIVAKGAAIEVGPLPRVAGDATQLMQLFQNLVSNAIKFQREGRPKVRLAARQEGGHWVISVSDNGIGIAAEYFERIFVMFQRLHTMEEYPGTGIGLAICKKIVDRHHGRIWLESKLGEGSTFYVSFPRIGGEA